MTTETQRWLEAGKSFAVDAKARVPCPRCATANLQAHDVEVSSGRIERHLECPGCGAYNAILLPSKPRPG